MKSFQVAAHNALGVAQSRRGRRLLQVVAVALILLFFGLALYRIAPDLAAYKDWHFDPFYLAIASLIMFARGPLGAYGWWLTVRRLGYRLPWWRSVRVVYYSNMAGFIPGSVWDKVSKVVLAEREGLPRMVGAISVGIESVMVLFGALIISSLSLLGWKDAPVWAGLGLLVGVMALVLRPQALLRLLNWLLVRLGRKRLDIQLTARDMLLLLPSFTLNWALYGVLSWALVAALVPNLPLATIPLVAGIFTVAWQLGYLSPVPQGVGLREGVLVALLSSLVGVPVAVATAAAVLARVLSILGVAVWAAISTRL